MSEASRFRGVSRILLALAILGGLSAVSCRSRMWANNVPRSKRVNAPHLHEECRDTSECGPHQKCTQWRNFAHGSVHSCELPCASDTDCPTSMECQGSIDHAPSWVCMEKV
jgi:hypothetical protein